MTTTLIEVDTADNSTPHIAELAEKFYKIYTDTIRHIMTYDLSTEDLKRISKMTDLETELVRRVRGMREIHG